MSRADGVQITKTAMSIFGPSHDPFYDMTPLTREDGTRPSQIIVATSNPGGYVPRRLLLPHQLYTGDARSLLDGGSREVWVLPVFDPMEWTQVALVPEEPEPDCHPQCGWVQTVGPTMLRCHREPGHDGIHRDDKHRAYFAPTAPPLEWLEMP
uniref:Minor tail protein n=2 Tax=unclassified bacterial viruses TaxID=12333 RepID=A0AAU7J7H6_9VIRU